MTSDHKRNTEGLAKAREKKSEKCQERVDKAIQQLLKEKEKINFNSVAERANVSKNTFMITIMTVLIHSENSKKDYLL
ncbi:hypothetical protein TheetDRAFT_2483 [Thermoanaerobacter ethanolicus JW 200]|nr:hypothetical protein TheetDRAFT_2483 [Thermoanaerobacter ethanolicus JW 200]